MLSLKPVFMPLFESLYERYGRLTVGFWVTLSLFAIICFCGLFILSELVLEPSIARLPYSASSSEVMGELFPWFVVFAVVAIIVAGALIRFGLVSPLLQRRRELEADLANAPPREQIEMLSEQKSRLGDQLDAVLDDNIVLREQGQAVQRRAELAEDVQHALIASANEALLLVGPDAQVRRVSSPMAALLKVRAQDASSFHVSELIKVYDASKEKPFEYPLKRVVEDVIAQASSIPKLHEVVLVDRSGGEQRIMLTVQAILDRNNVICGALVRADGVEVSKLAKAEKRGGAASGRVAGLPGRDAFDNRTEELMGIAQAQATEHTLALLSVDNLTEVYQEHGYWAVEELLWQLAHLVREEFGSAAELFHPSLMHFALLQAFEAPEAFEWRVERLRKTVEAHDFHWNKKTYRATLSIAVSSVNAKSQSVTTLIGECDRELRQARGLGGNRVSLQLADEVASLARSIDERLIKWLAMDDAETRLQMQSCELVSDDGEQPWIATQIRVEMEDGFWADPGAFLTSAARAGLLPKIDAWLVERVLKAANNHAALKSTHGPILIPLHIQSLGGQGFLDNLKNLVLDAGIETERLVFALDDFDCATHASTASEFVAAIKAYGFGFALTGARVESLSNNIAALKPRLAAVHSTVFQDHQASQVQASLEYFCAMGKEIGFRPAILDPLDEAMHREVSACGVALVAKPALGVGPLY